MNTFAISRRRCGQGISLVAALFTSLCVPVLLQADVVTDWNTVLLDTIKQEKVGPPVASRALAMMHAAMYDSVNSVERTHKPYRIDRPSSGNVSAEAAAAQAAHDILLHLFPDHESVFNAKLDEHVAAVAIDDSREAGIKLGAEVAADMIAWRSKDGSDAEVDYRPSRGRGKWRPTPPEYAAAMMPQWADLTPFAMKSPEQFRLPAPPALYSDEYAKDLDEVKSLGAANSAARSEDQTAIAQFWADGAGTVTPPGHWNRIAQTLVGDENSVAENARLFALLNIALADAAVACWDTKFTHNCWRPITAIRLADTDGNDATEVEADWEPLLTTPPFPSCTSGHSTFSGAAAVMLVLFFNTDEKTFETTSDTSEAKRSFTRISEAALEAGRSRIYGGIHFEFENKSGLRTGEALSKYIFTNFLTELGTVDAGAVTRDATPENDASDRVATDAPREQDPALQATPAPQLQPTPSPAAPLSLTPTSGNAPVVSYLQPLVEDCAAVPSSVTAGLLVDANGWTSAAPAEAPTSYPLPTTTFYAPAPQYLPWTTYYAPATVVPLAPAANCVSH